MDDETERFPCTHWVWWFRYPLANLGRVWRNTWFYWCRYPIHNLRRAWHDATGR